MKFYQITGNGVLIKHGAILVLSNDQIKANARTLRYLTDEEIDALDPTVREQLGDRRVLEVIKEAIPAGFKKGEVFGVMNGDLALGAENAKVVENPKVAADAAEIAELEARIAKLKGGAK